MSKLYEKFYMSNIMLILSRLCVGKRFVLLCIYAGAYVRCRQRKTYVHIHAELVLKSVSSTWQCNVLLQLNRNSNGSTGPATGERTNRR